MNDRMTERIRQTLEESIDNLDGATLSRLNQARQKALDAGFEPRRFRWLPLGAIATTAALVLAVAVTLRTPENLLPPDDAIADIELLSGDDLELVADLDFYLWLETELEENG